MIDAAQAVIDGLSKAQREEAKRILRAGYGNSPEIIVALAGAR